MIVSWRRSAVETGADKNRAAVDFVGGDAFATSLASGSPHAGQKFAAAGLATPQAGHMRGSGVPHSMQNLAPSADVAPHLWQFMLHPNTPGGAA
jgi:hypothetical protein